jgi:addiction module RelE/StbE family toxin
MIVVWSRKAQADRDEAMDYLEAESPAAALAVDDRIDMQMLLLSQFPEAGRPGRVAGTRELVVQDTSYIAAYRVASGKIRILRLLHTSRRWPRRM